MFFKSTLLERGSFQDRLKNFKFGIEVALREVKRLYFPWLPSDVICKAKKILCNYFFEELYPN